MFFTCECGKMVYYLDEDCPHCGRKIDFGHEEEDVELFEHELSQLRLFEC